MSPRPGKPLRRRFTCFPARGWKTAESGENTARSGPRKLVMGSDSYIHNKGKEDGWINFTIFTLEIREALSFRSRRRFSNRARLFPLISKGFQLCLWCVFFLRGGCVFCQRRGVRLRFRNVAEIDIAVGKIVRAICVLLESNWFYIKKNLNCFFFVVEKPDISIFLYAQGCGHTSEFL